MISHEHKLIFIHIPKCAGRSISEALGQPFDHYTAAYYSKYFPQEWNCYSKFTIIRNPYERLVSIYSYLKDPKNGHAKHEICFDGNMPDFETWLIENLRNYRSDDNLCASDQGLREVDSELGSRFWFGPQRERLLDHEGNLHPDLNVFAFWHDLEHVQIFLSDAMQKQVVLPHANRSEHTDWSRYYNYMLCVITSKFNSVIDDLALLEQYKFVCAMRNFT